MGAHYNLIAVTRISVQLNKSDLDDQNPILPEYFSKFYKETDRREWVETNSLIGDREKVSIEYSLSKKEIDKTKAFLNKAYELLMKMDIGDSEYLSKFLSDDFNELELLGKSDDEIKNLLSSLDNNYFLRYEEIPDMVVYTGWPKELKDRSRIYYMEGFVFISSSSKMEEYPEGVVEYEEARMALVKALSDEYDIANFIYSLGF